jgi:membrane protein DedA with SNARE-associated domain
MQTCFIQEAYFVHGFIQAILTWYFGILSQFGLVGVVALMAMESSIFPVPSELVVPPAAYTFSHLRGDSVLWASFVVLAGTFGSYAGSAITYAVSRTVGRPVIVKYGKYFFIPEKKLALAEQWVARYGAGGIFFARLLPVVRHLISIPAGIVGMSFGKFSLMTTVGSGIWCTVLTVFGLVMGDDMAAVLKSGADSPEYKHAFHNLTFAVVAGVFVLMTLYILVVKRQGKSTKAAPAAEPKSADA